MKGRSRLPGWVIAVVVYGGVRFALDRLHVPMWAGWLLALLVTVFVFWLLARQDAKRGNRKVGE